MKSALVIGCTWLAGCAASQTTIQSTWTDKSYRGGPLDELAVVALFDTRTDSLSFEQSAAEYLATQGIGVVQAQMMIAARDEPDALEDRDVRAQLAALDTDGVLIFRLIAIDERHEYPPPAYVLDLPPDVPERHLPPWDLDQRSIHDGVSAVPRTYPVEQRYVVAETALYDNRTQRLIWSAKSETLADGRFQRLSQSLVRTVTRRLLALNLIAAPRVRDSAQG